MGFKTKETANNTPSKHEVDGLIFTDRSAFYSLKNLDMNAKHLVDLIKSGSLKIEEFFSRFNKTKVIEKYEDAAENLENIFGNITELIAINDPDYFRTELNFGDRFYNLIEIDEYDA